MQLKFGAEDDVNAPNIPASSGHKNFYTDQAMHVALLGNRQNAHRSDIARYPLDLTECMIGREIDNRRIREEILNLEVFRQRKLEEEVIRETLIEREMISMPRVGSLVDSLLRRDVPGAPLLSRGDGFRTGIGFGTELEGGIEGRLSLAGPMDDGGFRGFHLQGQPRSVTVSRGVIKPTIDLGEEQVNVGAKDDGNCLNSLASSGNKTFYTDQPMHVALPGIRQNAHRSDIMRYRSDLTGFLIGREIKNRTTREEMEKLEVFRQRKLEEEVIREMRMRREISMPQVGLGLSLVDSLLQPDVPGVPLLRRKDGLGTGKGLGTGIGFGTELEHGIDGRLLLAGSMDNGGFGDFPLQGQPRSAVHNDVALKPIINLRKEQVVPMVNPSHSSVAGTKRRFEEPIPQVVEDDAPLVNLRKKARKELKCPLCQVTVSCEQTMETHLNGKKHKAKERMLQGASKDSQDCEDVDVGVVELTEILDKTDARAQDVKERPKEFNADSKSLVDESKNSQDCGDDVDFGVLEHTEILEETSASTHDVKERPKESNADSQFYCRMCNFGTMSEELMEDHRMGEKHWNLLQQNGGCVITIKTMPDNMQYAREIKDTASRVIFE
ncbi:uncharacterized protein LOC131332193 isoform X2 [Rhododendron vialii]|uniref:uncharacterized protein LOC131332193 isoform X2 n=1 Tax=Rhododendron vialii TaxID=182163 RepID=UPI00265DFAC5|nr:uncharacterized protein LOC131332193 isoform X2 [Rhododendron vialii]